MWEFIAVGVTYNENYKVFIVFPGSHFVHLN